MYPLPETGHFSINSLSKPLPDRCTECHLLIVAIPQIHCVIDKVRHECVILCECKNGKESSQYNLMQRKALKMDPAIINHTHVPLLFNDCGAKELLQRAP